MFTPATAYVFPILSGLAVAAIVPTSAFADVPQPREYRLENFRSRVPDGLDGATTVGTDEAWKLWLSGEVLFIDVMPQAPKPGNLPEGTFWRERTRDGIPGSYWLANVGYGRLHVDGERWFRDRLDLLTSGNGNKPLLFYCEMNCWMSWNAAKRALSYGYSRVYWFPDGTDGWSRENHPLKARYPDMFVPPARVRE